MYDTTKSYEYKMDKDYMDNYRKEHKNMYQAKSGKMLHKKIRYTGNDGKWSVHHKYTIYNQYEALMNPIECINLFY